MIELTAQTAGKYVLVTLVVYCITLGYSVYMAILNHKQAKVKDLMEQQNKLISENGIWLNQICKKLDKKIEGKL